MAEFTFTIEGGDEAVARFGSIPGKLRKEIGDTIKRLQVELVNAAQAAYKSLGLRERSGALYGGIQPGEFEETDSGVTATVVAGGVPYTRIQNLGGTISAKNVNNLTIPLDAVLTGQGVARFTAAQVISDPAAFGFVTTFFKNSVLFGELPIEGKREAKGATIGGVVPLFVLRPSVTLPAHPYMETAFKQISAKMPGEVQKAIDAAVKE
jgi:hypothetical protein